MPITYEEWCTQHTDVRPLIRAMKSSLPEQYIGFYLHKAFGDEIEYQRHFDWFGNHSLDIYIPSLHLGIEYDGLYYHADRSVDDKYKTAVCRSYDIYVIRVIETKSNQPKNKKRNEISYYFNKHYCNIGIAIHELCQKINRKYNTCINPDVDLERDEKEIVAYIQYKFHKKTIAYVWPEVKDYWLEEENGLTIFDVFHTNYNPGCFLLKCPRCNRRFHLRTKYFSHRRSLFPCECEYKEIERDFADAINQYRETGKLTPFDDSLRSRKLYDRMAEVVNKMWHCRSKEEAELYKKLGFMSPYIDAYLSLYYPDSDK